MVYIGITKQQTKTMILLGEIPYPSVNQRDFIKEVSKKAHHVLNELKWKWQGNVPRYDTVQRAVENKFSWIGPPFSGAESGGIYVTGVFDISPRNDGAVRQGTRVYFHASTGKQGDKIREILSIYSKELRIDE